MFCVCCQGVLALNVADFEMSLRDPERVFAPHIVPRKPRAHSVVVDTSTISPQSPSISPLSRDKSPRFTVTAQSPVGSSFSPDSNKMVVTVQFTQLFIVLLGVFESLCCCGWWCRVKASQSIAPIPAHP